MTRPLSQLIYHLIRDIDGSPRIITLHDRGLFGPSAAPLSLATTESSRVIALESYKGVYAGRSVVGYTWFVGPDDQPSPIFFGDALAEIERFLWDEIDRQAPGPSELPFLIGVGQGGIMTLAAAAAVPDLLSGVIAIDAFLPIVPGWEPPLVPLAGLPVLLLESAGFTPPGDQVLGGPTLTHTLDKWGATVTRQQVAAERVPAQEIATWVAARTARFHVSTPAPN